MQAATRCRGVRLLMLLLAWHLHEMPCTGQGLTAHVTWDSVEGELQVGLGSFEKQAHVGEDEGCMHAAHDFLSDHLHAC